MAATYLKMKDFYVSRPMKDNEWTQKNIITKISSHLEKLVPLNRAFNQWFMDYDLQPRATQKWS
jgi:hypothetical protein